MIILAFITFIIGTLCGALAMAFIQGASWNNREDEVYMKGFLAGQIESMKEDKHE